jgi:hypothetical protein
MLLFTVFSWYFRDTELLADWREVASYGPSIKTLAKFVDCVGCHLKS